VNLIDALSVQFYSSINKWPVNCLRPSRQQVRLADHITLCDKTMMKTFSYNAQLPSLVAGIFADEQGTPAVLIVDAGKLVLKPQGHPDIVLSPDEVVAFDIDHSRGVIVDHVAFDKVGNVSFAPADLQNVGYSGLSCRDLLDAILGTGFQPSAKPGIPWIPGQPFPSECNDDEDAGRNT
jgi:hypothetical protein